MKRHISLEASLLALAAVLLFGLWAWDAPRTVNADSNAGTNVTSTSPNYWAWNDFIGWINFHDTHTVTVLRTGLQGYASSSAGDVSLDCATTRSGNICTASTTYQVLNDGLGNLSGWGWNDTYGWISFCGGSNTTDCPGSTNYRVLLTETAGVSVASGYAWNDVAGWISFNCSDPGVCGTSDYKVITSWIATSTEGWLDSTTFDTGVTAGVQLNSFFWKGDRPAGTSVYFQFAGSNSSGGPFVYKGDDGSDTSWYAAAPDTSIRLRFSDFTNVRYFRYKARLVTNQGQTETPRVDDVIVNWSP